MGQRSFVGLGPVSCSVLLTPFIEHFSLLIFELKLLVHALENVVVVFGNSEDLIIGSWDVPEKK